MPFCLVAYGIAIFLFSNSQQWFFMWLMMELSTLGFISLYFYEKSNSESITLYFLIQSVAAFFILVALILAPVEPASTFHFNMLLWGSVFMKLGVFPFHSWVPAVTMSMKKFLTFLILIVQKIIPFMWLLANSLISMILLFIMSLLNLLWVSPQNLFQTSMKMVIILSSISHSSWLLLSLTGKYLWEIYFTVYVMIMLSVLLLYNEKLKNIFQKNERTPLFLIFLTLGGVPPFMGFYPKFFLIFEILQMKIILLVGAFIIISLIDLLVYSRISMTGMMKNKMSHKWEKMNEVMKWFLLVNVFLLGVLVI